MGAFEGTGKVALITGGSHGIGAAVARRLAGEGVRIVLADIDEEAGAALAKELDGAFARCDVREPADSEAAVALAVERFGGLDIAFLNAGIAGGGGIGDDFDLAAYRRAMGVNLDGVVFGAHAALPALRARGGGDIIATASMAGLTATPFDPVYGANKAAVVGLVRALGPTCAPEGIRVNALCPSFADTDILTPLKDHLERTGFPILEVTAVVDAFMDILNGDGAGEAWYVVPGRTSEPFRFRGVPGPR
ncbi:SDR family oxidoreductase [Spirillospora albida]|uniref:SDR family oxidoreductase n=1 Tax=Spirillospora albida TaxID=58123 RepID=UPI0004C1184A|nr:SDR family NAD(P)-dependent oxidoreductase [Spirillospora albida]